MLQVAATFRDNADLSHTLSSLVATAIRLGNPTGSHHLRITGHSTLSELDAIEKNPGELFRDFGNILELIVNAVKYSPQGSTVTLHFRRTSYRYTPRIIEINDHVIMRKLAKQYADLPPQNRYLLYITDEGIGIPTAEIPEVIKNGHRASNTTSIPGTGFGLSTIEQSRHLNELPLKITSPAPSRKPPDPNFPGTRVRLSLAGW